MDRFDEGVDVEYLSPDEDAFWQNTGRYEQLARPLDSFGDDVDPEIRDRYTEVRCRYFPLDEKDDEHTVVPLIVSYPAGTKLSRHAHQCGILFVVLRGSIYVPGRVLRPGDVCYAMAHEYYGPMLTGPEGALAMEIFTADAIGTDHMRPDGTEHVWNAFSGEERPHGLGYEGIDELRAAVEEDVRSKNDPA